MLDKSHYCAVDYSHLLSFLSTVDRTFDEKAKGPLVQEQIEEDRSLLENREQAALSSVGHVGRYSHPLHCSVHRWAVIPAVVHLCLCREASCADVDEWVGHHIYHHGSYECTLIPARYTRGRRAAVHDCDI